MSLPPTPPLQPPPPAVESTSSPGEKGEREEGSAEERASARESERARERARERDGEREIGTGVELEPLVNPEATRSGRTNRRCSSSPWLQPATPVREQGAGGEDVSGGGEGRETCGEEEEEGLGVWREIMGGHGVEMGGGDGALNG
ncbi:unnamed protein product [Lampetra fluviatilis]